MDFGITGQYLKRVQERVARFRGYPLAGVHRQQTGIDQPGLNGLGSVACHPPHPDPAFAPDAKRLHRELQLQVPRRASQRAVVRIAQRGAQYCGLLRLDYNEVRPQSSLERVTPARWRCCWTPQPQRDRLTLNPDRLLADLYGKRGQVYILGLETFTSWESLSLNSCAS